MILKNIRLTDAYVSVLSCHITKHYITVLPIQIIALLKSWIVHDTWFKYRNADLARLLLMLKKFSLSLQECVPYPQLHGPLRLERLEWTFLFVMHTCTIFIVPMYWTCLEHFNFSSFICKLTIRKGNVTGLENWD